MSRLRMLLLPALLVGCDTLSEDEFGQAWEERFCELYWDCGTYEMLVTFNYRDCRNWLRDAGYPDQVECRFDAQAATACIEALETAQCDGDNPEMPDACDGVYGVCDLPRVPAIEE